MILQALAEYYRRLVAEGNSNIATEGFERKEIPFVIILDKNGAFIKLEDTRLPSGKNFVARSFLVPKENSRSGSLAWQTTNLLWDHYGYVLASPKSDEKKDTEMAGKQHGAFVNQVKVLVSRYPQDLEIKAVHLFLSNGDYSAVFSDSCWNECNKIAGCILSFRIENQTRLVCENENVKAYIATENNHFQDSRENTDGTLPVADAICLITGEYGPITRIHKRTPIWKSKSNARIVSFQKNSGFDSYGKEQGANAPFSKKAEFAYTTALNRMLARDSNQKFQIGDATTVFWAEKKNQMENIFQELFGYQPDNQENEQDYRQLLALFRSPETGVEQANLDPSTKFYVLGLAPNAARVAVRFWYAGTVGSVADNIYQHFEDLSIVKSKNEWRHIDLRSLLRSTALREKDDKVIPNLAGDVMKSILTGTPYPQTLLSSVLTRIKSEQSAKGPNGKSKPNITYGRAALIKAILVRDTRYHNKNTQEVSMSLDISNTNPGYLLGRLFAVLERTQERANPGLNATIRDRFYGAASSTPITAFPYLMKLKNFHVAKLDNKGEVVNTEKQIGEILSKLEAASAFPTHLSQQDQGRFAVGYYHQRQEFFTKKEN